MDENHPSPPHHQPSPPTPALEADEPIDAVPIYRRRRIIIPVLLALMAALGGAWYWYVALRDFVSTDDAYVDADRVSVSSKILGRVKELTVDEGDTVSRGQVLVRLDDADLRAQLAQARASLTLAEENVRLARVSLARSRDDYDRASIQYKQGVLAKENFDHARSALEMAQAESQIALARVGTSRAQLDVVQTELAHTIVESPLDGVVAKRWVLTGDIVQVGQPIFSVYDRHDHWITANLEETKLRFIQLGDSVSISADTYPDTVFAGRVIQIGAATASQFSLIPPNNASGNFTKITQRVPVKISVDNPGSQDPGSYVLRPGMSVEVRIKVR
jgi:membrane fusion protein (multidrug efflux system)